MQASQLDTQQVLAFLAVAEAGSFSRAARRLHVTQPAVSKRVAQLEHLLGHPLFDRISRRVRLTEEGERLLPGAQAVRQSLYDFVDVATADQHLLSGRLGLGLSHYCGLHLLPEVLRTFTLHYPDVLLDLAFLDSEAAIEAVRNGRITLAYATLPPRIGDEVETTPLWDESLLPMAANHVVEREPSGNDLHALGRRLPVILPAEHTSTRQAIDRWLDEINLLPPAVIEVNQLDSIALLTSTGVGWSILPETLHDAQLVKLDAGIRVNLPTRRLGLVRRHGGELSRLAEAFHERVLDTLRASS